MAYSEKKDLFVIKTNQCGALIDLFTIIHYADFTRCNLTIKKQTNPNTGYKLYLYSTRSDDALLYRASMDSINFNYFECNDQEVNLSFDVSKMIDCLKKISTGFVTLFVNEYNYNELCVDNYSNHITCEMEGKNSFHHIPPITYNSKVTISTDELMKIYHTMLPNKSNTIKLLFGKNEILFIRPEDSQSKSYTTDPINKSEFLNLSKPEYAENSDYYNLSDLMCFANTNMSSTIDIYHKIDFVLTKVINICTLGKLYIFFAPATPIVNSPKFEEEIEMEYDEYSQLDDMPNLDKRTCDETDPIHPTKIRKISQ